MTIVAVGGGDPLGRMSARGDEKHHYRCDARHRTTLRRGRRNESPSVAGHTPRLTRAKTTPFASIGSNSSCAPMFALLLAAALSCPPTIPILTIPS
jgi:hypothetical protein